MVSHGRLNAPTSSMPTVDQNINKQRKPANHCIENALQYDEEFEEHNQ